MDKCYGCGGTGRILVTPKGEPVKPTCADYRVATSGDILAHGPILYFVEEIRWIQLRYTTARGWTNQQLRLLRLVDKKTMYMKRLYEKVTEQTPLPYGGMRERREVVQPTHSMIGQLFKEERET